MQLPKPKPYTNLNLILASCAARGIGCSRVGSWTGTGLHSCGLPCRIAGKYTRYYRYYQAYKTELLEPKVKTAAGGPTAWAQPAILER